MYIKCFRNLQKSMYARGFKLTNGSLNVNIQNLFYFCDYFTEMLVKHFWLVLIHRVPSWFNFNNI